MSRYDAKSSKIKISSYRGTTLQTPDAVISRKIYANEAYNNNSTNFTTSQFRILGTASGSLMRAKVYLVAPLRCSALAGQNFDDSADDGPMNWRHCTIGPRRNGLWKAIQSITTTVNSTTSYTVRPAEQVCWEDIFDDGNLPYTGGRETGTLGPDHTIQPEVLEFLGVRATALGVSQQTINGGAGAQEYYRVAGSRVTAYGELNDVYGPFNGDAVNTAFSARRTAFLTDCTEGVGQTVNHDFVTCLNVPPFACYRTEPYQITPTNIPFLSSCDVTINWDRNIKNRLMLTKGQKMGATHPSGNTYTLAWRDRPYLLVEFVAPPFALTRPVSIGSWRSISYTQSFEITPTVNRLNYGTADVTLANIRLDSFPVLMSVLCEKSVKDIAANTNGTTRGTEHAAAGSRNANLKYRDYFCPLTSCDISWNEKQKLLSDRTPYQMYRMFKRNSKSRYTFAQWRDLRCQYLIRADELALESGENVFDPATFSIKVGCKEAVGEHLGFATRYTLRVNCLYMSESLTMSQQSSSATSLLLSKTDFRDIAMRGKGKAQTVEKASISEYS